MVLVLVIVTEKNEWKCLSQLQSRGSNQINQPRNNNTAPHTAQPKSIVWEIMETRVSELPYSKSTR